MTNAHNPKDIVSSGYDALSYLYRKDDETPPHYAQWIELVQTLLQPPAAILDLGCGCGVPVARELANHGYAITGIDISEVQIARAKELVPSGTFIHGDFASPKVEEELDAAAPDGQHKARFGAIVCLYAMIHVPIDEQRGVLAKIASWLEDDGYALVIAGISPLTQKLKGWLGSDDSIRMHWSHPGAEQFREWIKEAGLSVLRDEHQPDPMGDGNEGHQFFLLQKKP